MDTSADAVTGIMENTTVKNMSDTIQSCVSDDDIIKIEEPDLEDYQSGDALGTPLSDLQIQVPIHANVPHTVDLEVDVEETDYCEKSDPDFKSFVVVEEASVRGQATGLQGEGNDSFNKIMNELNEILYFEQSASVSVNANKQEQHLVETYSDSTDNDPQLTIDAEFETERFLANDECVNVRVPMYSDTEVEAIAELSDRRAERTTDVAAKPAEKEPTHLDLESAVNHELEFDAKEPYMQNNDVLPRIHSNEDMYVDDGDNSETGQISVCSKENNGTSKFVDLETFGETYNSEDSTRSSENDIYTSDDAAEDTNDSKMGKVEYNPELCSTEFDNIKSEKESESSSIDENEIDEKRHDVARNNQDLKRTADIGLKDDLLNTFVEHFPSQPSTKDTGEVANEPENIHLYAGSDSMSDQACAIEVITEERHFGTGDMDEDDILYRGDSDVKDHLMYNGAFAAKGSDIVAGTADIDSEENTGNKTREVSYYNLKEFESGNKFEYKMLSEIKAEEETRKEPGKNKPLPALRSRVKESDRIDPFQSHKYNDDTEHSAHGAHAFPDVDKCNVDDDYFQNMSSAMKKFVFFWKREDVFSQWHSALFLANGHLFSNAEQYMMFMKAELFGDNDAATEILNTTDPRAINTLGRKVKNFSELIWIEQCLYVVKNGNTYKFRQNDKMKKELFATHPKILVEANPHDQIWGIGLADCDQRAFSESSWNGLNLLGYILTEVRDELMCEEGKISSDQKQVFLENMKVAYRNAMMFNDQSDAGK